MSTIPAHDWQKIETVPDGYKKPILLAVKHGRVWCTCHARRTDYGWSDTEEFSHLHWIRKKPVEAYWKPFPEYEP